MLALALSSYAYVALPITCMCAQWVFRGNLPKHLTFLDAITSDKSGVCGLCFPVDVPMYSMQGLLGGVFLSTLVVPVRNIRCGIWSYVLSVI